MCSVLVVSHEALYPNSAVPLTLAIIAIQPLSVSSIHPLPKRSYKNNETVQWIGQPIKCRIWKCQASLSPHIGAVNIWSIKKTDTAFHGESNEDGYSPVWINKTHSAIPLVCWLHVIMSSKEAGGWRIALLCLDARDAYEVESSRISALSIHWEETLPLARSICISEIYEIYTRLPTKTTVTHIWHAVPQKAHFLLFICTAVCLMASYGQNLGLGALLSWLLNERPDVQITGSTAKVPVT